MLEWITERVNEWMNEWMNEYMNEWINKRTRYIGNKKGIYKWMHA